MEVTNPSNGELWFACIVCALILGISAWNYFFGKRDDL